MGKKRSRNANANEEPGNKKVISATRKNASEIPSKEVSVDNEFAKLKPELSSTTINAVIELGFTHLTPVQGATIPRFMSNQDVAVEAITGSGKTIAFVIPTVEILLRKEKNYAPRTASQWGAIILSPTRELAKQITSVTEIFGRHTGLNTLSLIGGTKVTQDLERIRGAHRESSRASSSTEEQKTEGVPVKSLRNDIIVGTPGRVNDVISRGLSEGIVNLKELEVLVLDEADVLLDMGFQDTINNILSQLPKQRRTGLFSATQTRKVKALIRAGLRNPATISVKVNVERPSGDVENEDERLTRRTPTTLANFYTSMQIDEKLQFLIRFLLEHRNEKLIVFFATCACVEFFGKALERLPVLATNKIKLHTLHGKMVTKRRNLTFSNFTGSPAGVLFCTDVAARGIDLPDVDWIVQYDPPQDPDVFVHRVGRTARAGRHGKALVMVQPNEDAYIPLLRDRDVPIALLDEPHFSEETLKLFPENPEETLEIVKKLEFEDRAILEAGTRAFISYLRSYKEHRLQFIFRIQDMDLLKVTKAFVLVQLPKLSEFRDHAVLKQFKALPNSVVSAIAFKDKQREKQRQAQIRAAQEEKKKEQEDHQKRKQQKQDAKGKQQKKNQEVKRKKKGRQQMIYEEWDELAAEERLHKQFKKGKLSKKQYERKLKQLASGDAESSSEESSD